MKALSSKKSPPAPLPIGTLGIRREEQSLFSLLLEIESRLRKEARANSRSQTGRRKVVRRRRSTVNELSRYVE